MQLCQLSPKKEYGGPYSRTRPPPPAEPPAAARLHSPVLVVYRGRQEGTGGDRLGGGGEERGSRGKPGDGGGESEGVASTVVDFFGASFATSLSNHSTMYLLYGT